MASKNSSNNKEPSMVLSKPAPSANKMALQAKQESKPSENMNTGCCGSSKTQEKSQNAQPSNKNMNTGCCSSTQESAQKNPMTNKSPYGAQSANSSQMTRIVVEYDAGFGNSLFIRGHGANLNWDKGHQMRNVKANEWVWENDAPFTAGEFKVLLNDTRYEVGANHPLKCGATLKHAPKF